MKKVKKKKKLNRKISGRKIEKSIYDYIVKAKPKYFVYRLNENRRNPTPADIQISTPRYSILIEVKATGQDYIQKANVRAKQIERLLLFKRVNKRNISILCLYFSKKKKYILVDIEDFIQQAKYRIDYISAAKMGIDVTDWKKIGNYFAKINKKSR